MAGALATGALGLLVYHLTGNSWTAGATLLLCGALIGLLAQRASADRARHRASFQDALHAVAGGNWSVRVAPGGVGDFAEIAKSFNQFLEYSQKFDENIDDISTRLLEIPAQIADAMSEFSKGAEDQEASVEETSSLLANINT